MRRSLFSIKSYLRLVTAILLVFAVGAQVSPSQAAQLLVPGYYGGTVTIPDHQLPVPRVPAVSGSYSISSSGNSMTVDQDQERVVIDWDSFDIGKDASVHFDQDDSSWAALNRIYSTRASAILGKLSADGKVYLINQNGILFGPDSQVNVRSLVASALNISDADFLDNEYKFRFGADVDGNINAVGYLDQRALGNDPGYVLSNETYVSNQGVIAVDYNGQVYLVAPNVENSGQISAPGGRIILAGGEEFTSGYDIFKTLQNELTDAGDKGHVVNSSEGLIYTESGLIGLYGRTIQQDGVIRSVTALKKNGQIELKAKEMLSTGVDSLTESPVSEADETGDDTFVFEGGDIDFTAPIIDHKGVVRAHSGNVDLRADDRIFLDENSLIDVSGLWASRSGDVNEINAQLNSDELRDAQSQKEGILKGETVTFNALLGTSIGDTSGHLSSEEKTALERATTAGNITLRSGGDIVVKDGAVTDFSGGGILYDDGLISTTKLQSGTKLYDIGDASGTTQYENIVTKQVVDYTKFGAEEEYTGLYYGGVVPLKDYVGKYVLGSDAGTLNLVAPVIYFGGSIDGTVTTGLYQDSEEDPEYVYSSSGEDSITARGRARAKGGILNVGDEQAGVASLTKNHVVNSISIVDQTPALPGSFSINSASGGLGKTTYLSHDLLSSPGLEQVNLFTNTKIYVSEDVNLSLDPGSEFTAVGRTMEILGQIHAPGGSIELSTSDNVTTVETNDVYVALNEMIFLGSNSSLKTSGEIVNNSLLADSSQALDVPFYLDGGDVEISEGSLSGRGVIVAEGSEIDVSAGLYVNLGGEVTGGDAGSVALGGTALALDGVITGYSLLGQEGGTLTLSSGNIIVSANDVLVPLENVSFGDLLPAEYYNSFVLDQNRFTDSGFSQIKLLSSGQLTVSRGSYLQPSYYKFLSPSLESLRAAEGTLIERGLIETLGLYAEEAELIGKTSLTLNANGDLFVNSSSRIETNPEGSVSLTGANVSISGSVVVPSGQIKVSAANGDLVLYDGSALLAKGYNKAGSESLLQDGTVEQTPLDGGHVDLEATVGHVIFSEGAEIDVSAATPVVHRFTTSSGAVVDSTVAADAGSVSFSYADGFDLSGEINASASLPEYSGGSLSIENVNENSGIGLSNADLAKISGFGFDQLSLKTKKSLLFEDNIDASFRSGLVIDAPLISVMKDNLNINLQSSWIQFKNSYYPEQGATETGTSELTFTGDWIDFTGDITFSKIDSLDFVSGNSITFSDYQYTKPLNVSNGPEGWIGSLQTTGDLSFVAGLLYPTTQAEFSIRSDSDLTVERPLDSPSLWALSAGGNLKLSADRIYLKGSIWAPSGSISLEADRRLFLGNESLVSTAGALSIPYGTLEDGFWSIANKEVTSGTALIVDSQPESTLSLKGQEVIAMSGAKIDVSGGGSLFAYEFLEGTEGSISPFDSTYHSNRYVIVPGIKTAGTTIRLAENDLVSAGEYSVLPEEYAFLPGAIVVEKTGSNALELQSGSISKDGHLMALGQFLAVGEESKNVGEIFVVRTAEDVLSEGGFDLTSLNAGNAGNLTVNGATTVLDAVLMASPSEGYAGGVLALSATTNAIVTDTQTLDSSFSFEDPLPSELLNQSFLRGENYSGKGLQKIAIGTLGTTEKVKIRDGGVLEADNVTLSADYHIEIASGARVEATAADGEVSLVVPGTDLTPAQLALYKGLTVQEGGVIQAGDGVVINARSIVNKGLIRAENSHLSLVSDVIYLVSDDYSGSRDDGLYLTESLSGFEGFEELSLLSRTELAFLDSLTFSIPESLTIDAARIVVRDRAANGSVGLSSERIQLSNSGGYSSTETLTDSASLTVSAEELTVGPGSLVFDGFLNIDLISQGALTFSGQSQISAGYDSAGSGRIDLVGSVITTAYLVDAEQNADVYLDAMGRQLNIRSSGRDGEFQRSVGGNLKLAATGILVDGRVDVASGQIELIADGAGDIRLENGSSVSTRGAIINGEEFAGGLISLQASQGNIYLAEGSLLDVSAVSANDAGSLMLDGQNGTVTLNGRIEGSSPEGDGGSFSLNSGQSQDIDLLNAKLQAGGFNNEIAVESHSGNLTLGAGQTMVGRSIRLAASGGDLGVAGTIEATDGADGGSIELFAKDTASLSASGVLRASGGLGGDVSLSAGESGSVTTSGGSLIDVSGESGGGTVSVRAVRNGNSVAAQLAGEIRGADDVFVEAYKVYQDTSISSVDIATYKAEAEAFSPVSSAVFTSAIPANLTFLSGIEVRSSGDLALDSSWDFNSWAKDAGVLTLRAAGDLSINQDLVNHPNSFYALKEDYSRDSWAFNLVSGADLSSADIMRVSENGTLSIADSRVVYSESAPIRLASGGDVHLGSAKSARYMVSNGMAYSVASHDGDISVYAANDLQMPEGVIQTATGNINVLIGGNLNLGSEGAIRTTGTGVTSIDGQVLSDRARVHLYSYYEHGGDINVSVSGDLIGELNNARWDAVFGFGESAVWTANFLQGNSGLATMGGGDLSIQTGGEFVGQAGTFGLRESGSLSIQSGGDLNGRFVVHEGLGLLKSGSSIGTKYYDDQSFEAFATHYSIIAQGSVVLGTILNPDLAHLDTKLKGSGLTYSESASVALKALTGDVVLTGNSVNHEGLSADYLSVLPGTLDIEAARDIHIKNYFILAPSSEGNLKMSAGRDIGGRFGTTTKSTASIALSDLIVTERGESIYGKWTVDNKKENISDLIDSFTTASSSLLHSGDDLSASISAGRDISNLRLYLSKKAEIVAGRDIGNLYLSGQHVGAAGNDMTLIKAGRDLSFELAKVISTTETGLNVGGQGTLIVQAGNNLDLGSSEGIQTVGNLNNALLPNSGSDLVILVGFLKGLSEEDAKQFFDRLRAAGIEYSPFILEDPPKAQQIIDRARDEIIRPFFAMAETGEGVVSMVQSSIQALAPNSDLYLITNGAVEVGRSSFSSDESTGIIADGGGTDADGGGDVNIYVGNGDLDVLESRLVSKFGGDITVWVDHGDLNAGRGSSTAISPGRTVISEDPVTGEITETFIAAAVGSGIRTTSYDPDGEGPGTDPGAGDGYFFTPDGVIDANEGGISVATGYFGAREVRNSQNISFSEGAVGAVTTGSTTGLGALSGSSSVSEVSKITEEASGFGQKTVADNISVVDDFIAKWIEAKVIGYPDTF